MNIRKKGKWKTGEDKFVIEDNRQYVRTLPPADELNRLLCLDSASCSIKETKKEEAPKQPQRFAQDLLNEFPEQDATPQDIEEFKKKQDALLKDVLNSGDKMQKTIQKSEDYRGEES